MGRKRERRGCMQIKRKHSVLTGRLSLPLRDARCRRGGERKRRSERSPLSRPAGRTPGKDKADEPTSRRAFYHYYEITARSLRGRCREKGGKQREKMRPARYTPGDDECPNRARPLKARAADATRERVSSHVRRYGSLVVIIPLAFPVNSSRASTRELSGY